MKYEVTSDFRTEDEARAMIDAVPELAAILFRANRQSFSGSVYYDARSIADGASPTSRATLRLHLRNTEDGARLKSATTKVKAKPGESVPEIYVDHIDHRPDEGVEHYLHLAGPHDVMRWLAYDLDATWV